MLRFMRNVGRTNAMMGEGVYTLLLSGMYDVKGTGNDFRFGPFFSPAEIFEGKA